MSKERDTKTIWLEEGLKILAKEGPSSLSIDRLTLAIGKTKGSFYHHFSSRDSYIEALLEYHEKSMVDEVVERTNEAGDPHARMKKLTKLAFQISGELELAMRAWALYDPKVRTFQDRLDRRRLEYAKALYVESGMSADKAQQLSRRDYSFFIGLQQLKHHYDEKEFRSILRSVFSG
ncbi:MAG: TetR/AcrR family transcriptional regulator [Syntrophaceae bacterium]|nr:TetR/AcrR family transcriptional regulator [Syntrophaceae bacterium]